MMVNVYSAKFLTNALNWWLAGRIGDIVDRHQRPERPQTDRRAVVCELLGSLVHEVRKCLRNYTFPKKKS